MRGSNVFSRAQEEMLAQHCISMAHLGYGFTGWQVLEMAGNMCEAIGKDSGFSELKMTHPKKMEKTRDDAVNEKMLYTGRV